MFTPHRLEVNLDELCNDFTSLHNSNELYTCRRVLAKHGTAWQSMAQHDTPPRNAEAIHPQSNTLCGTTKQ
jgi:hypothetical protein